MKIEKGIISSSQLMLTVLCFIQGANLAIAFIYNISKRDTWICIITGYIISFIIILFYIALAQKFSDKNLLEIFDCIYGPYLGKVFSAAYILFFFFIMVQNLYFFGNFWLNYLMPETPMVPILIMFVFVCAWAVRNGIEVIARCSFLFVIITAALVVAVTVLLIKDMKFANLLPVFETPFMDLLQGTHVIAAIPLCEVVVFLMIIPYTNNIKQVKRSVLLGLTLGSTQLLITVIRDITVLGPLAYIATSPPFGAVRQNRYSKCFNQAGYSYCNWSAAYGFYESLSLLLFNCPGYRSNTGFKIVCPDCGSCWDPCNQCCNAIFQLGNRPGRYRTKYLDYICNSFSTYNSGAFINYS